MIGNLYLTVMYYRTTVIRRRDRSPFCFMIFHLFNLELFIFIVLYFIISSTSIEQIYNDRKI